MKIDKSDIATPALLLDLDGFEANLQRMADHCRKARIAWRPHAKTHKCVEIARRQIAAGAVGVCAATTFEAEAMVKAGIPSTLLTSPIVDRRKVDHMVQLTAQAQELMLAVGDDLEADLLAQSAERSGVTIDVLLDVDVLDHRTGAAPGEPALRLAQRIDARKSLRLRGIQAYAGGASHTVGFEDRAAVSRAAMSQAVETSRLLRQAGFDAPVVSGGSTGVYNIDSKIEGVTELQAGSFIFMDVEYQAIGGEKGGPFDDFQSCLTVLSTVVAGPYGDHVTVDAGDKAFASAPDPVAKSRPGLSYRRLGDEFGRVTAAPAAALPPLGERIEFIVPHCDPTVSLYDRIHAMRGEDLEAIWPVTARRVTSPCR